MSSNHLPLTPSNYHSISHRFSYVPEVVVHWQNRSPVNFFNEFAHGQFTLALSLEYPEPIKYFADLSVDHTICVFVVTMAMSVL